MSCEVTHCIGGAGKRWRGRERRRCSAPWRAARCPTGRSRAGGQHDHGTVRPDGRRQSIQKFPGRGAIETADPHGLDGARVEVARIDAHPASPFAADALPVHHASAGAAPHEIEFLVAPRVADSRAASSRDPHFRWLVVSPERSIPPANGAIAAREAARLAPHPDFDRAAVASGDEDGASPMRMVVRALGDG